MPWRLLACWGGVGGPQPFPYIHLLNKIVREHKVCVEVVDLLDEADTQPYFEMLEKGYNKWFSHTAKAIERSGRQEEFADLMPVLKKGVKVQKAWVDCDQPDLKVHVMSEVGMQVNCSASAAACVWLNQTPMYMFFHPFDGVKKWLMGGNQNVIAHELGHTMGMADQYEYGRNNSHEVYHTPDKQRTTMDSAKPFARFGCDDVDGFINLLDVGVFGNRRGGKEGWRSFCKGRNYSYVNGRPVVNAKYAVDLLSNIVVGPVLHIYDKQGQQIKRKQYIFAPSDAPYDLTIPFHPLQTEKDRLGRVVYQKNARGEERFCSYTYERTSCMAVKGDKLLFSYVQILNKKNRVSEIRYTYGRDIPSAFITFKQTGNTKQVVFSFGNENKVYNVSANGYLSPAKGMGLQQQKFYAVSALDAALNSQSDHRKDQAMQSYVQTVFDMCLKHPF